MLMWHIPRTERGLHNQQQRSLSIMNFLTLIVLFSLCSICFSASVAQDTVSALEVTEAKPADDVNLSPVEHSLCLKSYYCSYCQPKYFYDYSCHFYQYAWYGYDWCYGKDYCICQPCFKHDKYIPFYWGPPKFKIPRKFPKFPKKKFFKH
eukprot:TRINITY_DN1942_c0_g1_i1.p2 TRINITY_DN1942_c0_g1~~TRINITY_DN1942_c0_g1_i1.p2  ORF type:complete len:150 (-),score=11.05 TRINITY_DN1942_c0_g1_i1:1445-1894(-)